MDYQALNLLFRCGKEFSHEKIRRQELSDTECMICSYIFSHESCSQDDVSVALKTDTDRPYLHYRGLLRQEKRSRLPGGRRDLSLSSIFTGA